LKKNFLLYQLLFLLLPRLLFADDFTSQGKVRVELRKFNEDQLNNSQDSNISAFTRLETVYDTGPFKHILRGFGRVDSNDDDRSIIALEDAYASFSLDEEGDYILLGGYKTFNWSTTEVFHPVDVINSRNFDSDLDNPEKKGEFTIEFEMPFLEGILSIFYFPKFEEPDYPGPNSRVGPGYRVDRAVVVDGANTTQNKYFTPQFGFRVIQTIFDADVSLHYLNHVDRRFPIIGTDNYLTAGNVFIPTLTEVVPFYYQVQQFGGTYQQVLSNCIIKFEFASRIFDSANTKVLSLKSVLAGNTKLQRPADHTEVAMGMDYMFHIFAKSEFHIFIEATSIFNSDKTERADLSIFQRDIMAGFRLAINDFMGREFYMNIVKDIERENETIFNLSYNQRVTDNIKLSSGVRYISAPQKISKYKEGLEPFDGDGYFYFHLTRFF
jgi:hypothetical protein